MLQTFFQRNIGNRKIPDRILFQQFHHHAPGILLVNFQSPAILLPLSHLPHPAVRNLAVTGNLQPDNLLFLQLLIDSIEFSIIHDPAVIDDDGSLTEVLNVLEVVACQNYGRLICLIIVF